MSRFKTAPAGRSRFRKLSSKRTIVSDLFNRADNASSLGNTDTGQTWQAISGTWGIQGNKAYLVTHGASTNDVVVVETGVSDCEASVKISGSLTRPRLAFRVTDQSNFFFVFANTTGYQLISVTTGSNTTIGTSAVIPAQNDVVKAVASGSSIKIYINESLIFDITNTLRQTATKHGLATNSAGSNYWEDFKVEA